MTETVLLRQIEKTGDNNRDHRNNGAHARQLDEIAHISTLLQLRLLTGSFHVWQNSGILRQLV
jgi:hypothetical protein